MVGGASGALQGVHGLATDQLPSPQIALAVIIIVLVAVKLEDVTFPTDMESLKANWAAFTADPLHFGTIEAQCSLGTSLESSSLCVYTYVLAGELLARWRAEQGFQAQAMGGPPRPPAPAQRSARPAQMTRAQSLSLRAARPAAGLSLVLTFLISMLKFVTCDLCGLGGVLDIIFAAVGTAWWSIGVSLISSRQPRSRVVSEAIILAIFVV